jgi:hypothetical protein
MSTEFDKIEVVVTRMFSSPLSHPYLTLVKRKQGHFLSVWWEAYVFDDCGVNT